MFNRVQKEINQIINRGFDRTLICPQKLDRLVNLNIELGIAPGSILLNRV